MYEILGTVKDQRNELLEIGYKKYYALFQHLELKEQNKHFTGGLIAVVFIFLIYVQVYKEDFLLFISSGGNSVLFTHG